MRARLVISSRSRSPITLTAHGEVDREVTCRILRPSHALAPTGTSHSSHIAPSKAVTIVRDPARRALSHTLYFGLAT